MFRSIPFVPLASALVSRLAAYAILLIAAHLLAPADFGAVTVLMVVAAILNALVSGGGDMWLNRFTKSKQTTAGYAPWVRPAYLLLCATSAAGVVVAGLIAAYGLDMMGPRSDALVLAIVGAAVAGFAEALLAVVRASGRVTAFFVVRDFAAPLSFIAAIAVLQPRSAMGFFVIYASIWALVCLGAALWSAVIKGTPTRPSRSSGALWIPLLRHTANLVAGNLSSRLAAYIDVLALTAIIPLAAVGEYRIAAQFAIGFMVIQHFFFLGLPWQMRRAGAGDEGERAEAFARVMARQRSLVRLGFVAAALIWLLADPLLRLFGDRFVEAAWVLRALIVVRFAELLWGPQHEILISNGLVRSDALANGVALVVWIGAFPMAATGFSPIAAAIIAVAAATVAGQLYRYYALQRAALPCPRGIGLVQRT